jgi:hypothetical protein
VAGFIKRRLFPMNPEYLFVISGSGVPASLSMPMGSR